MKANGAGVGHISLTGSGDVTFYRALATEERGLRRCLVSEGKGCPPSAQP